MTSPKTLIVGFSLPNNESQNITSKGIVSKTCGNTIYRKAGGFSTQLVERRFGSSH
jgi:hypothetical protein